MSNAPYNGMTTEDLIKYHSACCEKMKAILSSKNADYTGGTVDPFANFSRVEKMEIASTEQGFLTRMLDKFSRINSFVKQGTLQVKDESIEDTLLDLANYSLLLAAYIKSQKKQNNQHLNG